MSLLLAILQALVLFAVAPLLSGITRVVRARMHNRRGPGVLQEYRDLFKLLSRQSVAPDAAGWVFRLTPFVMVGVCSPSPPRCPSSRWAHCCLRSAI